MFQAGQCWRYRAPPGSPASRVVIGAIVEFEGGRRICCCAVTDALQRQDDGATQTVVIPFLPLTEDALRETVVDLDGVASLPEGFASQFEAWQIDPRGASYFTVPFEGSLEIMIARQMEALVDRD